MSPSTVLEITTTPFHSPTYHGFKDASNRIDRRKPKKSSLYSESIRTISKNKSFTTLIKQAAKGHREGTTKNSAQAPRPTQRARDRGTHTSQRRDQRRQRSFAGEIETARRDLSLCFEFFVYMRGGNRGEKETWRRWR